jgi:hypothetical protein
MALDQGQPSYINSYVYSDLRAPVAYHVQRDYDSWISEDDGQLGNQTHWARPSSCIVIGRLSSYISDSNM